MNYYDYFIWAVFAISCGAFLLGGRHVRCAVIVMSIFVAGLRIEGIVAFTLPDVLSMLSTILLITGTVKTPASVSRLFSRLIPFFVWLLVVWVVGYLALEPVEATRGWARGTDGKPIVQLVKFLLIFPLGIVVADGLRTSDDVKRFMHVWTRIAVISAIGCMIQFSAYKVTGSTLGVYRSHRGEFTTSSINVAGMNVLRVSGLAGEPKSQGMAMVISLTLLLATWNRKLLPYTRRRHLNYILLLGLTLMLTFSSGAILMLFMLGGARRNQ